MATLTVGFDFGQFDTPTKGLFEQQALSLRLSSLVPADFATDINVIKASSDSASSNSLEDTDDPGQLWIDGRGDLWVGDQAGPVKIYRYEMGWESRRLFMQETGSITLMDGSPLTVKTLSEYEDFGRALGESQTTGVIVQSDANDLRTNQAHLYLTNSVGETSTTGFYRTCGRGGLVFAHPQVTSTTTWAYDRDLKNNIRMITKDFTLGDFAHHYLSIDFDTNQDKFMGYVTQPTAGTSVTTDGTFATNGYRNRVKQFGWNYGIYMRGYQLAGATIS